VGQPLRDIVPERGERVLPGHGKSVDQLTADEPVARATVGVWNKRQRSMDEEFLFWDNRSFYAQIGL
jgi:hypothetical protein